MPLNFKSELSAFAVGRRANSEEWNAITRSFTAADDVARLKFGAPAAVGSVKHSCIEVSANGQIFLGVVEAMPDLPRPGDGYARYDNVPITDMCGQIGVEVEGNVTAGAQARWNITTRKWTGAAQSATVATIPGCTFEETATAPGVTIIRVRRPNPAVVVAA